MRLPKPALPLVLLLVVSAPASTETLCADARLSAIGWTREDEDAVCSAARDALDLLLRLDLRLSERVVVRPLDRQGDGPGPHVLGRFDAETREIRILNFDDARAASAQSPAAFGVSMTNDLWRSYIGHEIAHAVADPYIASDVSHLRAAEYIASVVQLAMVSPTTREAILNNHRNLAPWGSVGEITPLYYFMAPAAFAVKSYRHFMKLPEHERRGFVAKLLRERGEGD